MKRMICLLLCFVTFLCAGCSHRGMPAVETENISRILCCGIPDCTEGIEVPAEDMDEMIRWLGTFTLGAPTRGKPLPPGSNSYWVIIEYTDGRSAVQYLDTAEYDGAAYHIEREPLPDCFLRVFGGDE